MTQGVYQDYVVAPFIVETGTQKSLQRKSLFTVPIRVRLQNRVTYILFRKSSCPTRKKPKHKSPTMKTKRQVINISESEQVIMKCPECKELSLIPTGYSLRVKEGDKEPRFIPILFCKAENCRRFLAVDNDTIFGVPEILIESLSS